jgi:sulfoquinovosidase
MKQILFFLDAFSVFPKKQTVALLLLFPFFAFAQSEPKPAIQYKSTKTEILFYASDNPHKILFILPTNRPILSVTEAKVKTLKQHLGSVKLDWKTGKTYDFFIHFYPKIQRIDGGVEVANMIFFTKKKQRTYDVKLIAQQTENGYQFYLKFPHFDAFLSKNKKNYTRLTWHIPLLENENVYGGGEQFSFVKLNGHKVPFLVEEQGIGRGDNPISFFTKFKNASGSKTTTFMPMAHFTTSQKRVFETNLLEYQEFDFKEKGWLHWSQFVDTSILDLPKPFFTIKANDNWQIIPKPSVQIPQPAWMFRTILGLQGGTDTVLHKLKILTDAGVQPSAVWTQDWCGRRITPFGKQLLWNWQLDTLRYPRFAAFRDGLRQKNIRLLGYINPFLAEGTALDKAAVALDNEMRPTLKPNDSNELILVADKDRKQPFLMEATGFKVHLLNLQTDWIENIVQKNLIDNGFSGWMADFGEWYPFGVYSKNHTCFYAKKVSDKEQFAAHNEYPRDWANTQIAITHTYLDSVKTDTLGIFMRATTQPSSHIYWAGDQNTNWQKNDGLPSLVPALLSSGLSGIAINHGDIGGFTSFKKGIFKMTRSRELLYRWIELCAFTPVFRTHEGLAPDYNMQVYSDTASAKFFAQFSKIHDDLHPYIMRTYRETETLHLPMVRHLMLAFPDDPNVADLQYEFMLGSDLLVAPVLKKGAKTVHAYLPKGSWQHFFTKKITVSKGEWFVFDAPLGQPAAFWAQKL